MHKQLFLVILSIVTISSFAHDSDYSVKGKSSTNYLLKNITVVELNCYCSTNISISEGKKEIVELSVEATLTSVGYHGNQEMPTSINTELMKLIEVREGNKLILISKENTYIHHFFLINKISVKLPSNITLVYKPIEFDDLEGRNARSKQDT